MREMTVQFSHLLKSFVFITEAFEPFSLSFFSLVLSQSTVEFARATDSSYYMICQCTHACCDFVLKVLKIKVVNIILISIRRTRKRKKKYVRIDFKFILYACIFWTIVFIHLGWEEEEKKRNPLWNRNDIQVSNECNCPNYFDLSNDQIKTVRFEKATKLYWNLQHFVTVENST